MHIVIVNNLEIPAITYGGTERVMWYLCKELVKKGHRVTFLVKKGSYCDFAEVIYLDECKPIRKQIPKSADLVHTQFAFTEALDQPAISTIHGNAAWKQELPKNSVFVSKNHAERYGCGVFVHNGLDFSDYGDPGLSEKRDYYHFLGKAAWRVKNVCGAIAITKACNQQLVVMGGKRINFKMGFRFTLCPKIKFYGMVGGKKKNELVRHSKGLIFPVLWHEPFGLAIIESLYFGCPVFGTPYGSLPELVPSNMGFLSASKQELIENIRNAKFYPEICHQYAKENFNSEKMTEKYLKLYFKVLSGESLNPINPTLQKYPNEKFLPFT